MAKPPIPKSSSCNETKQKKTNEFELLHNSINIHTCRAIRPINPDHDPFDNREPYWS